MRKINILVFLFILMFSFVSCSKEKLTELADNYISSITIDGKKITMVSTFMAYSYEGQTGYSVTGTSTDGKTIVNLIFYNTVIKAQDYSFGLTYNGEKATGVGLYLNESTVSYQNAGNLADVGAPKLTGKVTITSYQFEKSIKGTVTAEVIALADLKTKKNITFTFNTLYKIGTTK